MGEKRKRNYTVKDVMDLQTGRFITPEEIFSADASVHHQQRMEDEIARLRRDEVRYHCPFCREPLLVRGRKDKSFYFRHPDNPSAECPYRSLNSLTPEQINALKYDGAKESVRHHEIKRQLEWSLSVDSQVESGSVLVEKRVRAIEGDWMHWRQPDVQARINGRLFAFEIQLSTTFLTVVAGRREFYLQNGAMLFWIFDGELIDRQGMRFTESDVYFNNNRNYFFLTPETVSKSIKERVFRLMCRWEEPYLNGTDQAYRQAEAEVGLQDLTFDFAGQRVFYYDFDLQDKKIKREAKELKAVVNPSSPYIEPVDMDKVYYLTERWGVYDEDEAEEETSAPEILSAIERFKIEQERAEKEYRENLLVKLNMPDRREETSALFGDHWILAALEDDQARAQGVVWSHYHAVLREVCPDLTSKLSADYRHLLCALYSLREGMVIGTKLANLRALENHMYTHYRWFYRYFAFGIRLYKRDEELRSLQVGSTCYKHIQEYKAKRGASGFVQHRQLDKLIQFLFPELGMTSQ